LEVVTILDAYFRAIALQNRLTPWSTEPVGIERIREALEANDWVGPEDETFLGGLEGDGDGSEEGFGLEAAELETEMFGLKRAIHGDGPTTFTSEEPTGLEGERGEDDEVEKLESMVRKMQAVKGETPTNALVNCGAKV